MTQAVAPHDTYLSDFRAFEDALPPGEPAWLRDLRERALSRFAVLGFPTARRGNEPWKYTNVAPIAEGGFAYAAAAAPAVTPDGLRSAIVWDEGWHSLVFVNGRYAPALSTAAPASGARVASLAEAVRAGGPLVQRHLARHAEFQDNGFTALNTAFLNDGAFVYLPEGAELKAPVHLVFVSAGDAGPAVSYPRTLVVAGANSKAAVIESYIGLGATSYLTNAVTEIALEDGAQLDHYKLMLESEDAFHVGTTRVDQARDSTYFSLSYAKGALIGRNDLRVLLDGPGGSSHLNGLYVTAGSQHLDNYINIDHAKPHCTSRLYYRGILDGESRAVFGGTVLVRPGAAKTDSYQEDKNLILSEKAEVDSKPSLEIYADDVKCGHGATAGTVTEDAIFYMRSRGLDLERASTLLIKGFASQITDSVRIASLRAYLERLTLAALRGFKYEFAV
jgi:Fe-S cluster assembly protein SufD